MRAQEIVVINDMSVPDLNVATSEGYAARVRHETEVRLGEKTSSGYFFSALSPEQAGVYAFNFREEYDAVYKAATKSLALQGIHKPAQESQATIITMPQAFELDATRIPA